MKRCVHRFTTLLMGILLISFAIPAMASATTPFAWTATDAYAGDLFGVSCASPSFCVGVGRNSFEKETSMAIVSSTNPTGGAGTWKLVHQNEYGYFIGPISCPSESLCAATAGFLNPKSYDAYNGIMVSTDPTGSGSTWVTGGHSTYDFLSISCASASLCAALDRGGDLLTSTNPAGGPSAWTTTQIIGFTEYGIRQLSCPTASFCIGVGGSKSEGAIATSTNPTGGAGAWQFTKMGAEVPILQTVSCPSALLCVASGHGDEYPVPSLAVISSTNPTGGAGAWNAYEGVGLQKLSCVSASFCGAADYHGRAATSEDPTGSASTWSFASGFTLEDPSMYFPGGFEGISCPSASLCMMASITGAMVWGVPAVPPVNTSPPVASGTAQVNKYLTCEPGTWSGKPLRFEYWWRRDGVDVALQADAGFPEEYRIEPADQGHTLTCVITAINDAGSVEATSAGVAIPGSSSGGGSNNGNGQDNNPGNNGSGSNNRHHRSVRCVVPRLKGKKLRKAKRLLRRHHCRLGKVKHKKVRKHHKHKKVVGQKPKPKSVRPAGTKVSVTLG